MSDTEGPRKPAQLGTLLKHWGNTENNAAVDDKQKKICETSGLESLLALSRMTHVKVQGLALKVINSLREKDNGEITIESEEGFRPLVDLTKFPEEEVQKEAVWSLAILASNSSCQYRIDQEVGWHNFRHFADSPVPEIQAGTAILLGNLALEKRNQENLMVKGVPLLMKMLTETKDGKVRRAVVTALSNVSIIEGYGAKDVWTSQGIELMIPFIEQTEDPQLQIGALNTIANLCNHDNANELKNKVAEMKGLDKLVPLLDSKDEMIVKLSAMTIANLAADEDHRRVMHDLNIEDGLVRLLDSRDEEVQLGVAMAMNALSDTEVIKQSFKDKRAAEPLKELIRITKDRDIAKEARETLKKVAPEELATLDIKNWSDEGSSYTSEKSDSEYSSSFDSSDEGRDKNARGRDGKGGAKGGARDRSRSNSGSPARGGGRRSGSESDRSRSASRSDTGSVKVKSRPGPASAAQKRGPAHRDDAAARRHSDAARKSSNAADSPRKGSFKQQSYVDPNTVLSAEEAERKRQILAEEREEEQARQDEARRNAVGIAQAAEDRSVDTIERKLELQKQAKQKEEEDKKAADAKMLKELLKPGDGGANTDRSAHRERTKADVISAAVADTLAVTRSPGSPGSPKGFRAEDSASSLKNSRDKVKEADKGKGKAKATEKEKDDAIPVSPSSSKGGRSPPVRRRYEDESDSRDGSEQFSDEESESEEDDANKAPRVIKSTAELLANPPAELVQLLHSVKHKKGVSRDWLRQLDRYAALTPKLQLNRAEHIIGILVYIIYSYPDDVYPDIVTLALYILAVLGRYHVANQVAIRRARGGEQMQKLLHSTVDHVREHAALAIGAYSLNNPPIQVESSRIIPELIRMMQEAQTPANVRRAAAACLASLADNNKPNQALTIQCKGLQAAVSMVASGQQSFIRSALHLIAAVVSKNEAAQNNIFLYHARFLQDLLQLISAEPSLRLSITNTLVELVKKNPQMQSRLYHTDAVAKLIPMLNLNETNSGPVTASPSLTPNAAFRQLSINVLFLLFTLARMPKYGEKARAELVTQGVPRLLGAFTQSKDHDAAELAVSLSKLLDTNA